MSTAGNGKSYKPTHQFLQQDIQDFKKDNNDITILQQCITGFIMMQMTAKAGIHKHRQKEVNALLKEFKQLHDKSVFEGLNPIKLGLKDKKGAFRAINLIKERRCGKIKGWTCTNRRPQNK
jgi:hypothetical protein